LFGFCVHLEADVGTLIVQLICIARRLGHSTIPVLVISSASSIVLIIAISEGY
jgi:hypothetical protein